MSSAWQALPDRLGYVRLDGPRPALRTATGEFLRLHQVPERGRLARRTYRRAVADFARERAARQRVERWPEGRQRIAVLGRDRLATETASELTRLGARVHRLSRPSREHPAVDLVVAVAEPGPNAREQQWLRSLPQAGRTVLHGHSDGDSFLLMPLQVDGTEACADQVRRRRLAASAASDELAGWLASAPRQRLLPSVRTLALARIVTAAAAWAAGEPEVERLRHTLTVIHPDLRQTEHVVLGFDEPAPREARS